jgi:hypothetical protein
MLVYELYQNETSQKQLAIKDILFPYHYTNPNT